MVCLPSLLRLLPLRLLEFCIAAWHLLPPWVVHLRGLRCLPETHSKEAVGGGGGDSPLSLILSPPLPAGLSSVLLNCARIAGLLERLMKAVDTVSLRGGKKP